MPVLAAPDTITGPLTATDLDAARQHSTGNVWLMPRRATLAGRDTCNGSCQASSGCECWRDTIPTGWLPPDDCAPEGGKHADPVPSATARRDFIGARIGFALMLMSAAAVVGGIGAAIYARWPVV